MKINKIKCDMCGKVIKEDHPMKVLLQHYVTHSHYSSYKTESRFDVCEKCVEVLKTSLGGCDNEKDS